MKILVLGAGGMAGHVVSLYLREQGHEVETLSGRNALDKNTHIIDVTEKSVLEKFLNNNKFDVIVNCIGILVQQSEDRKDLAAYLNAYLPHFLENYFRESRTKIIHLSTDCVFSGENAPYSFDAEYDGKSYYDRSKALGEIINEKDITFRMSIIGPDMQASGVGLFNWFFKQTGTISGYTKAFWNGITTIELAKAINSAIDQDIAGLYQLVPNQNISKFELLKLFAKVFGRDDIAIKESEQTSIDKTLVPELKDFDFVISDYPTMLEEMRQWIDSHSEFYPHYQRKVS